MRIALVGDYPVDSTRIWGGVQAAFFYLVKELSRLDGLDVHVLTMSRQAVNGDQQLQPFGATLHFIPPFPRFEMARNFRTYQTRFDRKLAEIQPDIVHAQGATDHAYVALRSGYPTVITVHGIQTEDSRHQGAILQRLRKRVYSMLIERYNMTHTAHLIAIGRYVSHYFGHVLRPETQVYYIPNAIDQSFFDLEGDAHGGTILFAGRVIQRKRPLDLVQAFARIAPQFPQAQLRIAGEYRSEARYAASIQTFIQESGLSGRVHMLGGLEEGDVLREFAACDMLALPSVQETTPMVIAQAMAAGKPVVATPVGGVPEMILDGVSGYLHDVGDIEGLASALQRLLTDAELRRGMGEAARQFAIENYRADNVARRTYEVYRGINIGSEIEHVA
jgi:glycosyltransferase involved in cell wall biosynthesis